MYGVIKVASLFAAKAVVLWRYLHRVVDIRTDGATGRHAYLHFSYLVHPVEVFRCRVLPQKSEPRTGSSRIFPA